MNKKKIEEMFGRGLKRVTNVIVDFPVTKEQKQWIEENEDEFIDLLMGSDYNEYNDLGIIGWHFDDEDEEDPQMYEIYVEFGK